MLSYCRIGERTTLGCIFALGGYFSVGAYPGTSGGGGGKGGAGAASSSRCDSVRSSRLVRLDRERDLVLVEEIPDVRRCLAQDVLLTPSHIAYVEPDLEQTPSVGCAASQPDWRR
jgi:hypothetical protein